MKHRNPAVSMLDSSLVAPPMNSGLPDDTARRFEGSPGADAVEDMVLVLGRGEAVVTSLSTHQARSPNHFLPNHQRSNTKKRAKNGCKKHSVSSWTTTCAYWGA